MDGVAPLGNWRGFFVGVDKPLVVVDNGYEITKRSPDMFMLLIAIVVAAVLGAMLLYYGMTKYEGWLILAGFILCVATAGTAVAYGILGVKYISAGYKADIINREFHTNYTQAEVFFASDVIDTVRELDRKRIELNGSLMQWDQESGDGKE